MKHVDVVKDKISLWEVWNKHEDKKKEHKKVKKKREKCENMSHQTLRKKWLRMVKSGSARKMMKNGVKPTKIGLPEFLHIFHYMTL